MPYKTGTWGLKARLRAKKRNKYFREYKKVRDPIKMHARYILSLALRYGRIKKLPCNFCGKKDGRIEAHHTNYRQPLKVVWFCPLHHRMYEYKVMLKKFGKSKCKNCGIEILPPKYKYCSNFCNLKHWRK